MVLLLFTLNLLLTVLLNPPNILASEYSVTDLRGSDSAVLVNSNTYDSVPSVMKDGNVYKMWWATGNNGDTIAYAESDSLYGPWRSPSSLEPNSFIYVFSPSYIENTFDGLHVADPSVIKVNNIYYMYYGGGPIVNSRPQITHIGLATSTDGVSWNRANSGQPIISPALKTILNVEKTQSGGGTLPLYRLVNNGDFFTTTDENAKNYLISNGWKPRFSNVVEGALLSSNSKDLSWKAWHRIYNPNTGAHYYTYHPHLISQAVSQGNIDEGIHGYVYPVSSNSFHPTGTVPLYELFNTTKTKYLYTIHRDEFESYLSRGWKYSEENSHQGVTAYIYKNFPYGAGQPSVTYVNGYFYLTYTDTTGSANLVSDTSGSQYLIRSVDPTFKTQLERFDGTRFVATSSPNTITNNRLLVGVSVDIQYSSNNNSFVILVPNNENKSVRILTYDANFKFVKETIVPHQALRQGYSYQDGQALVSSPERHSLSGGDKNSILVDYIGAVGESIIPNQTYLAANGWDLYWRGATLKVQTLNGDLNYDGKVDILDFNLLVSDFGNTYTIVDFNWIIENFGK